MVDSESGQSLLLLKALAEQFCCLPKCRVVAGRPERRSLSSCVGSLIRAAYSHGSR